MKIDEGDPREQLAAAAPTLAELATQSLYREQPDLESMGPSGRAHTLNDFTYHFMSLADLSEVRFAEHVRYCIGLFTARGFPLRWLDDAWRHMEVELRAAMPAAVAEQAIRTMQRGVVAGAEKELEGTRG